MTILSVCLTNLGKFNRIENTHNIENSFKYFKSLLGRIKYGNKICNQKGYKGLIWRASEGFSNPVLLTKTGQAKTDFGTR